MAFGSNNNDPMVSRSIDYLDDNFPYWLTRVLNIGQPVMDSSIKTAAIDFDGDEFTFKMNPEFAAGLTDEERAFLMSHEAMHVARNDMRTWADPQYPDKDALGLAFDCIINDTLTGNGLIAPEWAAQGMRDAGFNCEGADVRDVYDAIMQQRETPPPPPEGDGEGDDDEQQQDDEQQDGDGEGGEQQDDDADADADESEGDDGEGSQSDGDTDPTESEDEGKGGDGGQSEQDGDEQDGDGSGTDDDSQGKGDAMNGGGHDNWSQDMASAAETHENEGENNGGGVGGTGSEDDEAKARERVHTDAVGVDDLDRFDFEALFRRLQPDLVEGFGVAHPPRRDWSRVNRRMTSLLPRTYMPARKDNKLKLELASKRMQLVVGLDMSGSITDADVAVFRELAKRLPTSRAEYIFVVASSYAQEVDRDWVLDTNRGLPDVGQSSGLNYARALSRMSEAKANARGIPSDAWRTARTIVEPGFRGSGRPNGRLHSSYMTDILCEFDSMNAWIVQAVKSGRLREYPKSVLMVSDAETFLSSASEDEASRWVVLFNEALQTMQWNQETLQYDPLPNGPQQDARSNANPAYRQRNEYLRNCSVRPENMVRMGDLLLPQHMVRKKARV